MNMPLENYVTGVGPEQRFCPYVTKRKILCPTWLRGTCWKCPDYCEEMPIPEEVKK